jgi:hypothetical protein
MFTITRTAKAADFQLQQAKEGKIQILSGKFGKTIIKGAVTKLNADKSLSYYSGDFILSQPLPVFSVGQEIADKFSLSTDQVNNLNSILQQEQERKIRNKAVSSLTEFDCYPLTLNSLDYSLASTFTSERKSDGLTIELISKLFNSQEWVKTAMTFYSLNSVSSGGAAKGEALIKTIVKSGKSTPETWQILANRTKSTLSSNSTIWNLEQLETLNSIINRLEVLSSKPLDTADSIM